MEMKEKQFVLTNDYGCFFELVSVTTYKEARKILNDKYVGEGFRLWEYEDGELKNVYKPRFINR